jgi:hypothetical protein
MARLTIFSVLIFCFIACKKESANSSPPILKCASSVTVDEDDPSGSARLFLYTDNAVAKTVIVFYSTIDSSARSSLNYHGISNGKAQINAGTESVSILISIYSDTLNKLDLMFKVHIDSIVNAVIQNRDIMVTIKNVDYATLVWSDEFNDSIINTANWNFEQGNNNGWGNSELEVYTNSRANSYISEGNLIIKAIGSSGYYTSARMTTEGKRFFTNGRIDIRAKLPTGKGIWPALWMLGTNIDNVGDVPGVGWPKCGEIDIMELIGNNNSTVYGTVHYDNGGHQSSGSSYSLNKGSFSDSYHVFSLIWQPHHLKWLVDNEVYNSIAANQVNGFAFNLPQFFIFNIAVGGNWPGNPDTTTTFPQTMVVDYIRVYQ